MIPERDELKVPILQFSRVGEKTFDELEDHLAKLFNITDDERQQRNDSGNLLFRNDQLGWVKNDLVQLGLLEQVRGRFITTDTCQKLFQDNPNLDRIDKAMLIEMGLFNEQLSCQNQTGSKKKKHQTGTNTKIPAAENPVTQVFTQLIKLDDGKQHRVRRNGSIEGIATEYLENGLIQWATIERVDRDNVKVHITWDLYEICCWQQFNPKIKETAEGFFGKLRKHITKERKRIGDLREDRWVAERVEPQEQHELLNSIESDLDQFTEHFHNLTK